MGGAAVVALASVCAIEAHAQETSGDIRGQVLSAAGAPVTGASVTVTHAPSNTVTRAVTDSTGGFSARGLRIGGPYTVSVDAQGFAPQELEDVVVGLGQTTRVSLSLDASTVERIVVTASAATVADVAIGPSVTFSLADLQGAPAINRDLKDLVRLDPRIYLDESFSDAIQCAGAHPRFNSLTVDGIGLNDGFGLNSNGYPTERMPFPYDAISQVSVELAPFDVQYGGFTACNINAVTKSGDNEFHGSLFYDYTSDSLRGDSIEGQDITVPEFDEKRYGVSVGGPIIPDRLFFFAAYEKFQGANLFSRGPEGSGAANEIPGFSQADFDRILGIAQNVYGYDPGGLPSSSPAEDEKYLVRVDWNITDAHRFGLTYNYSEGYNLTESDSNTVTQFEYFNHLYTRGAVLKAYAGQLFSDWTPNLSTEVRVSYNDVDFTQRSVNGTDVGEIRVNDGPATYFLGADDSRHSNDLDYTTLSFKALANYTWNSHSFIAGVERISFEIFNLFLQHTEGEFTFTSIDNFEAGLASRIDYGNARITNDPNDASATFEYDINTLYIQDDWTGPNNVTVTAGLRYEWYTNDDLPNENPAFLARNGFSNTENLDGKSLVQPRLGFTWDVNDDLTLRGGIGLYSGGNPNVWVSNSYSNDGITNVQLVQTPTAPATSIDLFAITNVADERSSPTINPGGALWGVPQTMFDGVASGASNSTVNAIDPSFEIPSEWKYAIGGTFEFDLPGQFGQDYRVNADLLYSKTEDAAAIVDAALEQVSTAPDGRPIYRRIDRSDPDCAVNPADTATCSGRGFNNDLILTNSEGGSQTVFSVSLEKSYDFGLDWSAAYAFVDSEDTSSMTSSVAFSNWTSIAVSDINNPGVATSNYEIPHRLTFQLGYDHAFIGDYLTKFRLFGQAFQSRPFSFVYNDGPDIWGDGQDFLHLIYVPTDESDPLVNFGPGFDTAAFFAYVDEHGLQRGAIGERNGSEGQWTNKFDVRFEQEFPGILGGHRSAGFLVLENVGNMINDDWGVFYQSSFPERTPIVAANLDVPNNRYNYTAFFDRDPEARVSDASFWSVRLGVKYEF
jgi:outer membrane receptor for ferrienterochelin and colicin